MLLSFSVFNFRNSKSSHTKGKYWQITILKEFFSPLNKSKLALFLLLLLFAFVCFLLFCKGQKIDTWKTGGILYSDWEGSSMYSLLFCLCGPVKIPTTTKGTLFPFLWTQGPYAAQAGLKLMISLSPSPSYRHVFTTHVSSKPFNSIKGYMLKYKYKY